MNPIKSFLFVCSFMTLTLLSGCQSHLVEKKPDYTYEVTKPYQETISINKEYVCQIRAIQRIELRSIVQGYLQKKFVDEGQYVHAGQMLFQIKPNIYKADVDKSRAEVALANVELANNKALVDQSIISDTEATMSAAKLAKVRAELELAKTNLNFTEIRAPFSGLVGKFGDVRMGSLLDEGDLLTTLSDNHKMWVYFNVPEAQYLDYMNHKHERGSQIVHLELANKQIYPLAGTISTIESDFSNTSGNIAFRATFDNPKSLLRHGETGKILWPESINNALVIPQKSTFEILDKKFVFVVDKHGVLHEREIEVAEELPHVFIIKSGLNTDEMFLLEGQGKLYKGDKIKYKVINPKNVVEHLDLYAN